MSTTWIWTVWTVAMLALAYVAMATDYTQYEIIVFMLCGVLLSAAAVSYERRSHPSKR
jgi:hypothetical protein